VTPWLAGELTSVALCWRLDRRDGVSLGFTAHDRDLIVAGLTYRAAPGMLPSAISLSDGFEADTLDISGALTSDAIRDDDLTAGRWDGALLRLYAVDWEQPEVSPLLLARGELGDVGVSDGAFTAELRGPAALLEQPAVEMTSPECRAELGDRRCRVDMAGRTRIARVVASIGERTIQVNVAEASANACGYGRLRWIGGANGGLVSAIAASDADQLVLREAPPFAVAAGALVEIAEGCDRTFETCRDRFANQDNFRGEPHLPGNDLLIRYPGA
jgi:uncharacterized phage protein (TIGR02218 family)